MPTCYISSNPYFRPQRMFISSITKGQPTIVTTTIDHNYITGLIIHFFIPRLCNMTQLNGAIQEITVTGSNTFTVPIDSTLFDDLADPADPNTCPQVVPIGENNSLVTGAVENTRTQ